jgi:hypothetical protein
MLGGLKFLASGPGYNFRSTPARCTKGIIIGIIIMLMALWLGAFIDIIATKSPD